MARKFFTRGRLWGLGLIVFSGLGFAIPFAMAVVGALMGWRDLDEDWPRWLVESWGRGSSWRSCSPGSDSSS